MAPIGRPDILWSVHKLARAITKWTRACDKRLARLILDIHHACDFKRQDLEDSRSSSGGLLCMFGSQKFVPISWMCKKQTSVSHSSTKAVIISLDAGLRMDGTPALDLWDLVIEVFHSSPNQTNQRKTKIMYEETRRVTSLQTSIPKTKPRFQFVTTILN